METIEGVLYAIDLTGYTRFIVDTSLLHAKEVITEILDKIYSQCGKNLILNKVEGDALFFYSESATKEELIEHSKLIHDKFHHMIKLLTEKHKTCKFDICQNLDNLHIKFFIHEGEFALHKIGEFEELIGKSVIEIHRLMKNSVKEDSYILVVSEQGAFKETYEHIGDIKYNLILLH